MGLQGSKALHSAAWSGGLGPDQRSHNPSVAGSSPARPQNDVVRSLSTVCFLNRRLARDGKDKWFEILDETDRRAVPCEQHPSSIPSGLRHHFHGLGK